MRGWRVLACGLALVMTAQVATAQDARPPDALLQAPKAGEVLRIERDTAPPDLQDALRRTCRLEPSLQLDSAIEIFVPAERARPMAIAHCGWIVGYSRIFLFERGLARAPTMMALPVLALPQGITSSEHVGLINWNPDSKTLTAVQHTDVCVGRIPRHTYRHQGAGGLNGFVLVRVEHAPACDPRQEDWTTLWEAPPWDIPK